MICCCCNKTALYRVGNRGFCKADLKEGRKQIAKATRRREAIATGFEEQNNRFEALMREADSLRSLHSAANVRRGRN